MAWPPRYEVRRIKNPTHCTQMPSQWRVARSKTAHMGQFLAWLRGAVGAFGCCAQEFFNHLTSYHPSGCCTAGPGAAAPQFWAGADAFGWGSGMRGRRFCAARPETLPAAGHTVQDAPGPEAAPCGIRACPPTCGLRAAWRGDCSREPQAARPNPHLSRSVIRPAVFRGRMSGLRLDSAAVCMRRERRYGPSIILRILLAFAGLRYARCRGGFPQASHTDDSTPSKGAFWACPACTLVVARLGHRPARFCVP